MAKSYEEYTNAELVALLDRIEQIRKEVAMILSKRVHNLKT